MLIKSEQTLCIRHALVTIHDSATQYIHKVTQTSFKAFSSIKALPLIRQPSSFSLLAPTTGLLIREGQLYVRTSCAIKCLKPKLSYQVS